MGQDTKIEWAHDSWNPWIGCAKVSAGCKNCYAEHDTPARVARAKGAELWGVNAERKIVSDATWKVPLRWDRRAAQAGERRRVFLSQCDPFEDRPDLVDPRKRLFDLIERTPSLDWLLLTKRPENASAFVPWIFGAPWPNVWIGASVEDQANAEARIPWLLSCPAAVRFLSCEPLLGPIDFVRVGYPHPFLRWHCRNCDARCISATCPVCGYATERVEAIDWVIVGGESGPNARPMAAEWLTSLRDQCLTAGVPIFIKQMGNELARKFRCRDPKGGEMSEWPAEYRIRQFPTIAV